MTLVLFGAAGMAAADHEGLPFTETFDDAHASEPSQTTAEWGSGYLVLPTSESLLGVYDTTMAGEDLGTIAHTTRDLALGDMNGDGWLDVIDGAAGSNGIYFNDGNGGLLPRVDLTGDMANTRGIAVGDFNRDGHLDVVAGNLNQIPRLYLNSGDGMQFERSNLSPEPARTDSIVVADFNGDGWPDVAVANQNFRDSLIYYHTGNPVQPFGPQGAIGVSIDPETGDEASQVILAGDLDNDGDIDIVLVNEDSPNRAFINDGEGNFTMLQIGAETDNSQGAALGDLDGDGYLDLVVGNYTGSVSRIYFNSGDPAAPFSELTPAVDLTVEGDPIYVHHVTVADVDGDGDLDILLGTAGLGLPEDDVSRFTNRLYLNTGSGSFEPSVDISSDRHITNAIVAGDLDGDGIPEIIAGNEDRDADSNALPAMSRVYRNVGTPSGATARRLSGYATSARVDTETLPIVSVSLDASFDPIGPHDRADFWVSSNGGVDWLKVEPGGTPVVFPEAARGTDLRWRAVLSSLSPIDAGAFRLDSVTISADAPSFTSAPVAQATVGEAYAYDATAIDPNEGDVLTFTAPSLPTWLTFIDNLDGTAALSGTPTQDEIGQHEVVLEAADPNGFTAQQSFTISVAAASPAPVFESTPVTSVAVGADYAYAVVVTDAEGEAVTLTAPVLPDWLTLTDNGDGTWSLDGTPGDEQVGDHEVVLEAADPNGATAQQSFTIAVGATGSPVFDSAPVVSATAGAQYEYPIATSDPDDDEVTVSAPVLPDWLQLVDNGDGTWTLSGTPGEDDAGDHAVELMAEDATGATASQAFTVTVASEASGEPDNTAPEIGSTPAESATQGTAYSYTIEAADADDGDTLTIEAPTLPAWLTLTDNGDGTATLSGTPAAAHVGAHDVVVRVTDAAGATAEQSFTVTVAGSQPPPSDPTPPPPSSSGGSGSAGWLELLGIAFAAALIRRRRRGPLA